MSRFFGAVTYFFLILDLIEVINFAEFLIIGCGFVVCIIADGACSSRAALSRSCGIVVIVVGVVCCCCYSWCCCFAS